MKPLIDFALGAVTIIFLMIGFSVFLIENPAARDVAQFFSGIATLVGVVLAVWTWHLDRREKSEAESRDVRRKQTEINEIVNGFRPAVEQEALAIFSECQKVVESIAGKNFGSAESHAELCAASSKFAITRATDLVVDLPRPLFTASVAALSRDKFNMRNAPSSTSKKGAFMNVKSGRSYLDSMVCWLELACIWRDYCKAPPIRLKRELLFMHPAGKEIEVFWLDGYLRVKFDNGDVCLYSPEWIDINALGVFSVPSPREGEEAETSK